MTKFTELSVRLPDGYEAYARYWSPSRLRGAVLYHHGIQSHCGWFHDSAARLSDAGYAVLQVDRRGSGRNERDRGHAESADQLIADALAARDELIRLSGRTDHHVVGVSWGGKLAVAALVTDPTGVKSLNLVTPGLFPLVGVSKQQMAKIGFAMLYEPHRSFDIPLNDADRFTNQAEWHEFFTSDALTLRQCTAGFFLASRRMDKIVAKLPQSNPVPVHLLLAEDERIIDNDKTVGFVRELGFPTRRIVTYADSRHSLEVDAPEHYTGDLIKFINKTNR